MIARISWRGLFTVFVICILCKNYSTAQTHEPSPQESSEKGPCKLGPWSSWEIDCQRKLFKRTRAIVDNSSNSECPGSPVLEEYRRIELPAKLGKQILKRVCGGEQAENESQIQNSVIKSPKRSEDVKPYKGPFTENDARADTLIDNEDGQPRILQIEPKPLIKAQIPAEKFSVEPFVPVSLNKSSDDTDDTNEEPSIIVHSQVLQPRKNDNEVEYLETADVTNDIFSHAKHEPKQKSSGDSSPSKHTAKIYKHGPTSFHGPSKFIVGGDKDSLQRSVSRIMQVVVHSKEGNTTQEKQSSEKGESEEQPKSQNNIDKSHTRYRHLFIQRTSPLKKYYRYPSLKLQTKPLHHVLKANFHKSPALDDNGMLVSTTEPPPKSFWEENDLLEFPKDYNPYLANVEYYGSELNKAGTQLGRYSGPVSNVGQSYSGPVSNIGQSYGGSVSNAGQSYGGPVDNAGLSYGTPVANNGQSYGGPVSNAGQSYGGPVANAGQSYGGPVSNAGQSYGGPVTNAGQSYGGPVSNAGQSYGGPVANAGHSYDGPVSNAGQSYGGPITHADQSYGGLVSNSGQSYGSPVSNGGQSYTGPVSNVGQSYAGPISNGGQSHRGPVSDAGWYHGGQISNTGQSYDGPVSNNDQSYESNTSNGDQPYRGPISNNDITYNGPSSNVDQSPKRPTSNIGQSYEGSISDSDRPFKSPISNNGQSYEGPASSVAGKLATDTNSGAMYGSPNVASSSVQSSHSSSSSASSHDISNHNELHSSHSSNSDNSYDSHIVNSGGSDQIPPIHLQRPYDSETSEQHDNSKIEKNQNEESDTSHDNLNSPPFISNDLSWPGQAQDTNYQAPSQNQGNQLPNTNTQSSSVRTSSAEYKESSIHSQDQSKVELSDKSGPAISDTHDSIPPLMHQSPNTPLVNPWSMGNSGSFEDQLEQERKNRAEYLKSKNNFNDIFSVLKNEPQTEPHVEEDNASDNTFFDFTDPFFTFNMTSWK